MGPSESLKSCFQKYFTFSGRATRSEFWWFWGIVFAGSLILSTPGIKNLSANFLVATCIPWFAVACRRMHDTDRSGAFLLLPFGVILAGMYTVAIFMLLPIFLSKIEQQGMVDISSETTLGELQKAQIETIGGLGYPWPSPWAFVVFGVGILWLVYLLSRPSTPGPNRYGPPPSEVTP